MLNFTLANGRFRLIRELGYGATASVHLAHDNKTNQNCAIKILSPSYLLSPEALPRMRREFVVLSQLQDPHIIQIHEIFEDPPFFTMDYIDGLALDQWNAYKGDMPECLVISLAKTLSKSLSKAHKQGVIHRDIKPSNILISPEERPVIVDFGMMRVENGALITATGMAIGTMGYIAPEQLENAKEADQRSDIYSLGITLMCLATSSPPISSTHLLEKSSEKLSPALQRILMRATLNNPAVRTQSMDDLYEQLAKLPIETPCADTLHIPTTVVENILNKKTLSLR